MKIENKTRLEEIYGPKNRPEARVWIEIWVDGVKFNENVYLSGPRNDVKDYYEGKITMEEISKLWKMK